MMTRGGEGGKKCPKFDDVICERPHRCIRELAPELSEKFPTICEFNSYFFELELISKVSDRFLR